MEIGPQLTRRLNSRNSIFAQYSYTRVSYPGYTITMELQSAMGGYQRTWNRRLKTSVSAGPQWVQGSSSSGIPSSTNLAINANATYEAKPMIYSVVYSQAASGGSGVSSQFGTRNKDLNGTLSRQYGKDLSVSATAAYMRTQGLSQTGVTDAMDASTSVTRRLGRSFNASASYSIVRQTTSAQLTSNALTGHYQVIGFGIGYSPRDKRFKK
jgi:hypothetical protein